MKGETKREPIHRVDFPRLVILGALLFLVSGCHRPVSKVEPKDPYGSSNTPSKFFENLAQKGPIGVFRDVRNAQISKEEQGIWNSQSTSRWWNLAAAYVGVGDFPRAAMAYRRLASIYEGRADMNMSFYALRNAENATTKLDLFTEQPSVVSELKRNNYTGARLEPIYGCYTGAFVDNEKSLPYIQGESSGGHREVGPFNEATGVHHAIYFTYLGYGRPFPSDWIGMLRRNGAAAQIAFEPTSYRQVQDDDYLEKFARDARDSKTPIFLRFASEMNGDWVVYHKSSAEYIQMFRRVASVMHRVAPNVAMVWCPFEIPERFIPDFFPGDDAVDWVGVNIYSVLYNDNDPGRNAQHRNPTDALRYVYDRYSAKHPIFIGEYGAANMSSLDYKPRADYAIVKMHQFYDGLRLRFPRVKAVHWLSMNAIKDAVPGRQLNNYSLLAYPSVTESYSVVNSYNYFLKDFQPLACAPVEYVKVNSGQVFNGDIKIDAWIKSYSNFPTIVWLIDGHENFRSNEPSQFDLRIPAGHLKKGPHRITCVALDEDGFEVIRKTVEISVQ